MSTDSLPDHQDHQDHQDNIMAGISTLLDRSGKRSFSLAIAVLSFLCIAYYVFQVAPYYNYLYSDMSGFWVRALDRLNGKEFIESQFLAWPPWYHIILADLFKILNFFGLGALIRLETALTLNLILFACSVYALHRACIKCFDHQQGYALAVICLYAFGFPAWYFNAFLLSENFATPLFVIAGCLVYYRGSWPSLVAAALLFAVASIVRPAIAPYGLAFVIGFLVQYRLSIQFILRSAAFSILFFMVVGLGMLEVSRISHGKVSGLSANGGLDFFIANSDIYKVNLNYRGWHNMIIVPAMSWRPENGVFETTTPYFEQDFYYSLGWNSLQQDPYRFVKNIAHIKNLFFSDMLPSRTDAPGFEFFRGKWDTLKFLMFLSCGLFFWIWRDLSKHDKPFFAFMFSTVGITMLVSYVFTGEPRYTYSIIFIFYIGSLKALQIITAHGKKRLKLVPILSAIYIALWGLEQAVVYAITPVLPDTIQARYSATQDDSLSTQTEISKIHFPYSRDGKLEGDDKRFVLHTPGEISFKTTLARERGNAIAKKIKLDINSAWATKVWIDGKLIFDSVNMNFFQQQSVVKNLSDGDHILEVRVNYYPTPGGLAINYNYIDEENWNHRQFIGVSTGALKFVQIKGATHE